MKHAYDHNRPISIETEPVAVGGSRSARMAVVLTAPGCIYNRSKGGCRFCGFQELSTRGDPVTLEEFENQADWIAAAIENSDRPVQELDIYNSGSFLADEEIPRDARLMFFKRFSMLASLKKILIESRPEHISEEKLGPLVKSAGQRIVEVGMGLESASDLIRLDLMNKGFERADFERAAGIAAACGAGLLAYVLIKPPGLSEKEAFEDTIATAHYLAELSARLKHAIGGHVRLKMALQPAFVARGTELEKEYLAGRYKLLNLWTVVDIVLEAAPLIPLHVALWDEGLARGRVPAGCSRCTDMLRSALREFNATGEVSTLSGLSCSCRTRPEGGP